jgi:hypothetical protein
LLLVQPIASGYFLILNDNLSDALHGFVNSSSVDSIYNLIYSLVLFVLAATSL